MTSWQQIDTNQLNRPRPVRIRGVDVTVYFGPDDMPVGIRGDYEQGRKKFVIEFKYDGWPEPFRRIRYDNHAHLHVGQISGRLYEVELDVDAMDVNAVRLLPRVGKVLDTLAENAPAGLNRLDNYVAASGAFKQVQGQLASAIAP